MLLKALVYNIVTKKRGCLYEDDFEDICTSSVIACKSNLASRKYDYQYYFLCNRILALDYWRLCDLLHCQSHVDLTGNSNWNGNGSLFIPLSAGVVSR